MDLKKHKNLPTIFGVFIIIISLPFVWKTFTVLVQKFLGDITTEIIVWQYILGLVIYIVILGFEIWLIPSRSK